MNRLQLVNRVRSLTRDFTGSMFREQDVIDYLNEAVDRFQMVIKHFEGMLYLEADADSPILLPKRYHHMLAVYSAGRCFAQDERNYQASTLMNEFETKLDELKQLIESGELVILNTDGTTVDADQPAGYVHDNYFTKKQPTSSPPFDVPYPDDVPSSEDDDDILYWE